MGLTDIANSFKQVIVDDVGDAITAARHFNPKMDAAARTFGIWSEHDPKQKSATQVAKAYGNTALVAASLVPGVGVVKAGSVGARTAARTAAKNLPDTIKAGSELVRAHKEFKTAKTAYKAGVLSRSPGWEGKHVVMRRNNPLYGKVSFQPKTYISPHIEEGVLRSASRATVKQARRKRRNKAVIFKNELNKSLGAGVTAVKRIPRVAKKATRYATPGIAAQGIDYSQNRNKQYVANETRATIRKVRKG